MNQNLDPLATSEMIISTYRRYLRSLLPVRDPKIAAALEEQIRTSTLLTKGPYLEATPPYASGASLRELIQEGVLHQEFTRLDSGALPLDRPLYRHQEQAIRKAAAGQNIVVATGTGSGKTESFLLPILNELVRQHAEGGLGPGVRALLLYPMNALANDQMKRLRKLLAGTPHLTFGRYTGDTLEQRNRAHDEFEDLNPGEPRLPNELLSREEMRQTPPHILLTNYAMLEYLLLRPADMDLFEGEHGGHWKFIAVDEAHVYDGAKAAELAMLLRRVKDRVSPERKLQCLATSATVGDDTRAVTKFAAGLFNAPFNWVDDDPSKQDLVWATRRPLPTGTGWGPLSEADYRLLAELDDPGPALIDLAAKHGREGKDAAELLRTELRTSDLRTFLIGDPRPAEAAAAAVFDDTDDPQRALTDLVDVGSRLLDSSGTPVLSARYHLFARATEGAYTCLSEQGPHVSLGRREICEHCSSAAFEFGACQRCGTVYLTGTLKKQDGGDRFAPRSFTEQPIWLRLGEGHSVLDEDDAAFDDHVPNADVTIRMLCTACGALNGTDATACHGCASTALREVQQLIKHKASPPCLACGLTGNAIRRFESGDNAAPAVVTTALYQSLPAADDATADNPGEGRKLLMFSDSRQAAAFFAPYLEQSYSTIQHRRLVWMGLQRAARDDEPVSIDDLIHQVSEAAVQAKLFRRRQSKSERERTVALWIMQELFPTDDRQALEGRGLLRITLGRDEAWPTPRGLTQLGLGQDEAWDFLGELVRSLRSQGVVTMPEGVAADDETFGYRKGPIYVRSDGSEPVKKVLSWSPTRGVNRRLDYVRRVLEKLGSPLEAKMVLEGCWKAITAQEEGWLKSINLPRRGTVRQLDHTWLDLSTAGDLFQCSSCLRLAPVSVRGVCTTLRCDGMLEPFQVPDPEKDDDHYRAQYRSLNPIPLSVKEHTAQWTGKEAGKIQQDFVRGKVNALSCSTTFELGVDVGELQTVLLRNMPPTTANYVQRAGRAGRRAAAAALVVTYAQRRSHDLSRFQRPEEMINGKVRAPYVPLGNERIDRRHAHSVAMAAYFRHCKLVEGRMWKTAGEFFLGEGPEAPAPSTGVETFLKPVPEAIREALERILPQSVQQELDVRGGAWAERLAELLETVRQDLSAEVAAFEDRKKQAIEAERWGLVQQFDRTLNTLRTRDLIGYLANRNVLPKYGFPVDTVELRTSHTDNEVGRSLELSRDLSSAIYEYAPGSQIVAGGVLWTSAGVHRLPNKELYGKLFMICKECGYFQESIDELQMECPSCDTAYPSSARARRYIMPEFGFVAAKKTARPGTQPPVRSWNGSTYVLASSPEEHERVWKLQNGGKVTARSGARGKLIAISDGPNRNGHLICDWCGWGAPVSQKLPKSHAHPVRDTECTGPLKQQTLAHPYETDLLELSFDFQALPYADDERLQSLLSAILEGAAEQLQISRDDINGTIHPKPHGRRALVIYDQVPGGAGNAMRISERLGEVLEAALSKVQTCDCGEETSCYSCLRTFYNQWIHELLKRGTARDLLSAMVPAVEEVSAAAAGVDEHAPGFIELIDAGLLPVGTTLVDTVAGTCSATLLHHGELLVHGEIYAGPQDAADAIEQDANGWAFWAAELPDGPVPLAELRERLLKS